MYELESECLWWWEIIWKLKLLFFREFFVKGGCQVFKDYVFFLLIIFLVVFIVLVGNVGVNLICNLWLLIVIFCGYFIQDVEIFIEVECEGESKGYWYL